MLPDNTRSLGAALIGYIAFGVSFWLFATANWPMIPHASESQVLGTAYGIGQGCQSLSSLLGPLVVGAIMDSNKKGNAADYYWVNIFLLGGAAVGLAASVLLIFLDRKHGGVLSASNKRLKEMNFIKST